MKQIVVILLVLLGFAPGAMAQDNENFVRYDGMYIAQTGGDGISKINTYKSFMCLRFMENGKMYAQTVSTYAPEKTAAWLGPKVFERSGTVRINDSTIEVLTNNEGSNELAIEGPMKTHFKGKIISPEMLRLELEYNDGQKETFNFKFVEIEKWIKIVK